MIFKYGWECVTMVFIDEKLLEERFLIRKTDHPTKVYSVSLLQIQQQTHMEEFIKIYGAKLKAVTPDVVATYFCTNYGWALAGLQHLLSLDMYLDFSLSNTEMQIYYDKEYDYYGLTFKLKEYTTQSCIQKKEKLEEIYVQDVTPLLLAFVDNTSVKMRDLWGQMSLGLYNGHNKNIEVAGSQEQKKKLENDFILLTRELEPVVFKANKKNPLDITFRMIESARDPDVYQKMKPTCCLYFQTEGAKNKCYSCPRLSDNEREQRKLEIRARLNA